MLSATVSAVVVTLLVGPALAASPATGQFVSTSAVPKEEPSPEAVFSYAALCVLDDSDHGWRPCRGTSGDALSYQDFYRVAGRQDLTATDEARWFRRQARLTAGGAAVLIGVASLAPRLFGKSIAPIWLTGGVIAGGFGLCIWGAQVSQEPLVNATEASEIARSYNRGLRERLGLPPLDGHRLAIGIGYQRAF
jgi:hypothetical protein